MEENFINRKLSDSDTKIVASFTDFLTVGSDANYIRTELTELYINYTRLLCKSALSDSDVFITNDTDCGLYCLSEIIRILKSE